LLRTDPEHLHLGCLYLGRVPMNAHREVKLVFDASGNATSIRNGDKLVTLQRRCHPDRRYSFAAGGHDSVGIHDDDAGLHDGGEVFERGLRGCKGPQTDQRSYDLAEIVEDWFDAAMSHVPFRAEADSNRQARR